MRIISLAIQKGGTGKTTTALNLAYALAELGRRVLLVDIDPQASLTMAVGVENTNGRSLADVLGDSKPGRLAMADIIRPLAHGLDLAPSDLSLSNSELGFTVRMGRETVLKKALANLAYDYCLIDCGPSLGMLVVNALTACHGVIAPVVPDALGLRGLSLFLQSLESIRAELNPGLEFIGVLVTQYDKRLNLHQAALEDLRAGGVPVLPVIIPKRAELARSAGAGQPVTRADLAEYYKQLAECIEKWQSQS